MGRVGRRPSVVHVGGDGERIVAFAQAGKPPGNQFFLAGIHLQPCLAATEFKAGWRRVFAPGDFRYGFDFKTFWQEA